MISQSQLHTDNAHSKLQATSAAQNAVAAKAATEPESSLKKGFHELLGSGPGDECALFGLALSIANENLAANGKSLCLCTLAGDAQEYGQLYGHGLTASGISPGRLVMVSAAREKDLLWTLEEALTSGAFSVVIGALGQQERLYAFAQSRRLKLRSAAAGIPLYLLRHWQSTGATAANGRWRVKAMPSRSPGHHTAYRFLGPSRLQLKLERMSSVRPQTWEIEFDAARHLHMARLLEYGSAGKTSGSRRQAA